MGKKDEEKPAKTEKKKEEKPLGVWGTNPGSTDHPSEKRVGSDD